MVTSHLHIMINDVFTLPDTMTNKDADKKLLIQNCVKVFTHSDHTETDTNIDSHWVL